MCWGVILAGLVGAEKGPGDGELALIFCFTFTAVAIVFFAANVTSIVGVPNTVSSLSSERTYQITALEKGSKDFFNVITVDEEGNVKLFAIPKLMNQNLKEGDHFKVKSVGGQKVIEVQ
ncbi:MAG: hypothetical protein AAB432_02140 [Patescibacteria group bacterium]